MRSNRGNTKFIAVDLIEHLGDIVACEPVVNYLRKKYKNAYLVWFVRKPYKELIDSNPQIDRSYEILCLTEWIVLKNLNIFDEVVDLHVQGRMCPLCLIPLKKKSGDLSINLDNYYEHGNILSAFSNSAGISLRAEQPKIHISREIKETIDRLNLPDFLITVHCSSNEISRDWPPTRWLETIRIILDDNQACIAEIGTHSIINLISSHFVDLCGKLSILESAEVIRRSALFVGIDSGPAQLANAVQTPGVILLGDYRRFRKYMPYSGFYMNPENVDLVYSDGPVADLTAEKVVDVIQRRLSRIYSSLGAKRL